MTRDPLVDRCVDVFQAFRDADYNDYEAMGKVFEYLAAELRPIAVYDPEGLWDDYLEGRQEVCDQLLKDSILPFNL